MIMVLGPHKKKSDAKARGEGREGGRAPPSAAAEQAEEHAERSRPRRPAPKKERGRSENLDPEIEADNRSTATRTNERHEMPKNKTHSGASKRFRVTGSGKIRREKAGLRHNLEKKPSKVTRRLSGTTEVAKADTKRAKKLLGL